MNAIKIGLTITTLAAAAAILDSDSRSAMLFNESGFSSAELHWFSDLLQNDFDLIKRQLIGFNPFDKALLESTSLRVSDDSTPAIYTTRIGDKHIITMHSGALRMLVDVSSIVAIISHLRSRHVECIRRHFRNYRKPAPQRQFTLQLDCPDVFQLLATPAQETRDQSLRSTYLLGRFVVLHELGHIINYHFSTEFSPEQELKADTFATAYLMYNYRDSEKVLLHTVAYLGLTSGFAMDAIGSTMAHPSPGARLVAQLEGVKQFAQWTGDAALLAKLASQEEQLLRDAARMLGMEDLDLGGKR